jgi:C4-dicarboxylate-specific signal transduction histidine kinase
VHRVELSAEELGEPLNIEALQDGPNDRYINLDGLSNVAPLVALHVQDNGPGISAEVLKQLFEPYFTTKPRGQGNGLGLCIVQRLVKESHGALRVHSSVGKGTTFTVYLPGRNDS